MNTLKFPGVLVLIAFNWFVFANLHCGAADNWNLVFSDEFDVDGSPDPLKWDYESGYVRNDELQYYTVGDENNAFVKDGVLHLVCRNDLECEHAITSACLITRNRMDWTYGRFEIRAKLPVGLGTWPAIWLLNCEIDSVGWPLGGEIDIMEHVGFDPGRIHVNVHTAKYNHVMKNNRGTSFEISTATEAFHVYAMEWNPDGICFYCDDVMVFTFVNEEQGVETWPFDQPFYLLLNLAFGGAWGGEQGVDLSVLPAEYLIDFVRVFQR